MQHEILFSPTYSLLKMKLAKGESIMAESGAMVSMSPTIEIKTKMKGGLFGALKRSVVGESAFMNTFLANEDGEITFAPSGPGDIKHFVLNNNSLIIQSGSYLVSDPSIELNTKFGGAKSLFGGEGMFLIKATGTGDIFISSYGAIYDVELGQGESYIVDTGHMVAFEDTVSYSLKKVGGLKSLFFSGEGLVFEFKGPGKVFIQSRNISSFASLLLPFIKK